MLLFPVLECRAAAFTVRDIRIQGLQRISAGTVFNYLPIKVGDTIDQGRIADSIRTLFKTGFFSDVRFDREGDVLVVTVRERPAIADIKISGNKDVQTEDLMAALKDIGLAEGRVFNRSLLDKVEQELRRQYFSQGKYGVKIQTTATPLERNRVGIAIDVTEGEVAKIKQINIVGNRAFEEEDLLDVFELGTTRWYSFYTRNDQYSRQKLSGDLEKLRSFYLDRGYIKFAIDSTQVSISPDKKDIFITVSVVEGDVYTISDLKLAGRLVVPKEELFSLVTLGRGEVFSRKLVTASSNRINEKLGNAGYAFANVNSVPEIDDEQRQVAITFFIDPGKRVYVRRINMSGNNQTRDEVLRREMRQMEAAWFSSDEINRSRARLQRLGYFDDVTVETPAVPGTADQVDVNISVKESPSGNLLAGVGYSQSQGVILNASINQNNFLGTGKQVSLAFNTSAANTVYQIGYTNPYYTDDGISRGFILRYRETDAEEADISEYSTDVLTAGVNYGVPISEFNRIRLNFDVENTKLKLGSGASDEVRDFVDDYGDAYLNFKAGVGWSHDSRNSAIFPERGGLQSFSAEFSLPGSDLLFYKLLYRHQRYFPLTKDFILSLRGEAGYGDGYGTTDELPLFENFYAGGGRSVRGFKDNSLGPRDSNGDPLGGDTKVAGSAELIFPTPFAKASKSVRLSAFVDAGNVYGNDLDFDVGEIRYSAGVGLIWLSPLGALTFSLAQPLNPEDDDDVEVFQFSFGQTF